MYQGPIQVKRGIGAVQPREGETPLPVLKELMPSLPTLTVPSSIPQGWPMLQEDGTRPLLCLLSSRVCTMSFD